MCGKCHQGFDELQAFGDHACHGENQVLLRLRRVIDIGGCRVDFGAMIDNAVRKNDLRLAVEGLEDSLRRGDLSA